MIWEEWAGGALVAVIVLALVFAIAWPLFLADWFLGPCHSGHYVTKYIAAHSATRYQQVGDVSVPLTTHHPERCSKSWVCDVRCNALNTSEGLVESHPKHGVLSSPEVIDKRCPL